MILSLAMDAVKIKCGFENAVMTGNYECAYALGIMAAVSGNKKTYSYSNIIDLKQQVFENLSDFKSDSERINRLYEMLDLYEPSENIDDQMRELFEAGMERNSI